MQELCKEGGVLLGCFASPTVRWCRVQSQACGSETVLNQTVSGNANTGSIDRHLGVVAHRRQRQEDQEFSFVVSLRPAWAA